MFGSIVIELILGLVWMYLLLSTICSAACEFILAKLQPRSGLLQDTLRGLFAPKGSGATKPDATAEFFLNHGLIHAIPNGKAPSYIPSSAFATALIDSLIPGPGDGQPPAIAELRKSADTLPDSMAKDAVLAILDTAGHDLAEVTRRIEEWYSDVMDRVSGIYKRNVQLVLFITGITVATAINADSLMVAKMLTTSQELRATVISKALDTAKVAESPLQPGESSASDEDPNAVLREAIMATRESTLPLGWSSVHGDVRAFPWLAIEQSTDWKEGAIARFLSKLAGLLMTAAAVSFGAPFWFDLLNRVTNLRATGPKPERLGPEPLAKNS